MKEFPLDHIAVVSRDLEADAAFYARLGFTVEKFDADWAMLRDANGRGIALLSPGGAHPPHFALRAASREAVESVANDCGGHAADHRDGSVSVYVKDPSGNTVELIYYPEN